jgi:fructosamine-3-kinase
LLASSSARSGTESLLETISLAASESLGRTVKLERTREGGYSGGGGASTFVVEDSASGEKFFVKSGTGAIGMLAAELRGVQEIFDTGTVRVPRPIAAGEGPGSQAFAVFECLRFAPGGVGSQFELGQRVARMHRIASRVGYGFHVNNTIGATPQQNPWTADWADFWIHHRLEHMLKLTDDAELSASDVQRLCSKTRELISHNPSPSLLHGDLWGGNKGFVAESDGSVAPCVFDPATYYGDREADVAMTHLFGGFTSEFYDGYNAEYPLHDGHEQRRTVYNLYHILNHDVLFGGMYLRKAQGMIEQIMRY